MYRYKSLQFLLTKEKVQKIGRTKLLLQKKRMQTSLYLTTVHSALLSPSVLRIGLRAQFVIQLNLIGLSTVLKNLMAKIEQVDMKASHRVICMSESVLKNMMTFLEKIHWKVMSGMIKQVFVFYPQKM